MSGVEYAPHLPVLVDEVTDQLAEAGDGTFLDCTSGGGGHIAALLNKISDDSAILGLDQDGEAVEALQKRFSDEHRVTIARGNFRDILRIREVVEQALFSGILFDFGLSSHHLDGCHGRGFSFQAGGRLDMRMDDRQTLTVATIVNEYPEKEIVRVLKSYGEEPRASRIARIIVSNRPFHAQDTLTEMIRGAVGEREQNKTLARCFQALRVEVNDEMRAIDEALPAALDLLKVGGRLAAISYHSLEDRKVKQFGRQKSRKCICDSRLPVCTCGGENDELKELTRRAIVPGDAELKANPRSRSAKLRVFEKVR